MPLASKLCQTNLPATPRSKTPKASLSQRSFIFFTSPVPSQVPISPPAISSGAAIQATELAKAYVVAPVTAESETTTSEVAWALFWSVLKSRTSRGTKMMPPPTPKSPEVKPTSRPIAKSRTSGDFDSGTLL